MTESSKTPRRKKGFERTSSLLSTRIRKTGEKRGFAVTRVLTHWPEIVGTSIASIARPVDISYGRGAMGATLSVLTTGAQAPMLEMQKEQLREKVNATYGYNAIARIKITQTAPTGFSEGQAQFIPAKKVQKTVDDNIRSQAASATHDVSDPGLKDALEKLGQNVILKQTNR